MYNVYLEINTINDGEFKLASMTTPSGEEIFFTMVDGYMGYGFPSLIEAIDELDNITDFVIDPKDRNTIDYKIESLRNSEGT